MSNRLAVTLQSGEKRVTKRFRVRTPDYGYIDEEMAECIARGFFEEIFQRCLFYENHAGKVLFPMIDGNDEADDFFQFLFRFDRLHLDFFHPGVALFKRIVNDLENDIAFALEIPVERSFGKLSFIRNVIDRGEPVPLLDKNRFGRLKDITSILLLPLFLSFHP